MSLLPLLLLTLAPQQGPIRVVTDIHADPMYGYPATIRPAVYQDWIAWTDATLDQLEPLGVRISFLTCGEFAEYVWEEGGTGPGSDLLRRLAGMGGQIGSHSHNEYHAGAPHDWRPVGPAPTLTESREVWADNVLFVNRAIEAVLGPKTGAELARINAVRGSHVPSDTVEYELLMREFGFRVRQGGPSEDLYQYFSHYPMNPYQPATWNELVEDPTGWFVEIPAGPVIGRVAVHKGILQDFTLEAAQAMFLQVFLNWRYAYRTGAPEKVWDFGLAAHCGDLEPGGVTALAYPAFCQWVVDQFAPLEAMSGVDIFAFATQAETGKAFGQWRATHPAATSFSYPATTTDWSLYPYLVAVGRELQGAHWVGRIPMAAPWEFAHELEVGGSPVVVAWNEKGTTVADFGAIFGPGPVRVIGAETDVLLGTDPTHVVLGAEPVIVAR